ncbi:TIGR03086 family metal-binding protein [Petropleomorpha daqingensis]|uniref:Uncharacterized protein (TIGR03086 family) n=1 Tax=Petropleomorpha daqingensis TaxID=2026353 RepID=A0A853CNC0_9ACTN|nr:TIGR03086 family metal-binding protein [Petropleomorpha daqingensis]NYJ08002.1 uncharacterized protein (TIGR03086 family) [Petropleomorpha daqingensis]
MTTTTVQPDIAQAHRRALDATGSLVAQIRPDQWGLPTPDDDWDVRALVGHVVEGNLWVAELAAGRTIDEVGDRFAGDVLGADPRAAYDASATAAASAFEAPGALDAPCAVSYGPVPGRVYAGHRLVDVLVHGWDLAVALGLDPVLAPDLVEISLGLVEPDVAVLKSTGAYGGDVPVPEGASPQTRLLALLGRQT